MSELKPCPFCGVMPMGQDDRYMCSTLGCVMQEDTISAKAWNTRPIEDDLRKRIAELEAESERVFDLVRELRTYCIFANWDNPDTEDEFNEFDAEVCKWLSEFMESEE